MSLSCEQCEYYVDGNVEYGIVKNLNQKGQVDFYGLKVSHFKMDSRFHIVISVKMAVLRNGQGFCFNCAQNHKTYRTFCVKLSRQLSQ